MTTLELLDRYGWPAFGLICVGLFFWKAVWPLLFSRLQAAEKLLHDQFNSAQAQNQSMTQEFLRALERRDQLTQKTVDELAAISRLLEIRRQQQHGDRDRKPPKQS